MRGHGRLSLWVRLLQRVATLPILAIVVVEMHLRVQPRRGPVALGPPSPREVHVVVIAGVHFENIVGKSVCSGAGSRGARPGWRMPTEENLAH